MARQIEIKVGLNTKESEAQVKELGQKISNAFDRPRDALGRFTKGAEAASTNVRNFKSSVDSTVNSVNSLRSAVAGVSGAFAALGVTRAIAFFTDIARASVNAAISIDKQINSLKALTGSAEAAQRRFQELFKLAQQTPGLTTSLATTLDAQLRVFNVSQRTINQLLPVVGRLNAISPLGDPRQFVNNLTQLISQNFERQDLKELVGQSPIAGQLIAKIFNVDNPTNAEAIRKAAKLMGVTTVTRLAEELIDAAENSQALKNVTESLGAQFEKLEERITIAIAPIGDQISKVIMPAYQALVKEIEYNGPIITEIIKNNAFEMKAFALAVAATAEYASQLIGVFSGLDKSSGMVRNIAILLTAIGNPTQLSPLLGVYNRNVTYGPDLYAPAPPTKGANPEKPKSFAEMWLPPEPPADRRTLTGAGRGITDSQRASARESVARAVSRINIAALENNTRARMAGLNEATVELTETYNKEIKAREKYTESLQKLGDAAGSMVGRGFSNLIRTGRREFNDANRDSARAYGLRLQGIDDLFNRGALSPEQAEALRRGAALQRAGALNANLAGPNAKFEDPDNIRNLRDEAEQMTRLGTAISNTERFMRGFNSAIISVGDAFDRFGQNVAQALTNTKDLLNGLKQAVLQFFNDLLGRSLQNLVGQVLAPIAGLFGQGGQLSFAGAAGNLFRTPPTFSQSAFVGIGNQFFQSSITAPSSVSSGGILTLDNILRGVGGGGGSGIPISAGGGVSIGAHEATHAAGGIGSTASRFSFGALGKSIGAAAPLLGLSIGSSLGGQSLAGQILGGAGGVLGGLVAGAATGGITGGLGSAFALSGALGPAALVAAPLLIAGGILLGKAKQRRQDEELSGQYLTQALQAIDQLAAGVSSGSIPGSEARALFESNIIGTFRQQISGLKTKSVVESRLTNQVRDLRNVFEARIPPLIAEQERKAADSRRFAAIDSRLIPQFAGGGYVGGIDRGFDSVSALLRPGELVLNRGQQAAVIAQSSPSVFRNAGVPAVNTSGRFDSGGYAQPSFAPSRGAQSDAPIVIYLDAVVDAEGIAIRGMSGESGRHVILKQIDATNLKKRHR